MSDAQHPKPSPMPSLDVTLQSLYGILARNPDRADAPEALDRLQALARQMDADGYPSRHDPSREILARVGDKWSPLLLMLLDTGSFRHATLRRLVEMLATERHISQRMLTLRLRNLEQDGLISRRVLSTTPAAVMYSITETGRSLVGEIHRLFSWSREHAPLIRAARARFELENPRATAADRDAVDTDDD